MAADRRQESCYSCGRVGTRGFTITEEKPGWYPRMAMCTAEKACRRRAEALTPPEVRAAQRTALEV
jgi:hypothetical protein